MELDVKVATRKSRDLLAIIEQLSHDKKSMAELNVTLMNTIEKQNENIQKQNENIEKLCKRIEYLELVNRHQEEIIAARNKRLFGRKSEKMSYDESQYWLFNEIEAVMREKVALPEKSVTVKEHSRTKRGRKPISDKLPREEIVHDIPDSEKICPHSGNIRPRIGEDVREEVSIIPMQVFVKRHIYPKYGPCDCKECKTDKDAKPIISAEPEKRIIPGSMADETLLAYLAVSKFCDSLPFYRQEKIMRRYGIEYSRETMCNQMIRISEVCSDLVELMWNDARSGPVLNMDETVIQVLHEPGRDSKTKSWMWVMIGRPEGKKVVLFHYHQKRSGEVARKLLEGYSGYLQSDGYSAYNVLKDTDRIIPVGCWAHVRRKFIESKGLEDHVCHADEALSMISKLFHIDSTLREKNLCENDFVRIRQEQTQPILDEFYCWIHDMVAKVPPSFNLAKAIRYTINEWHKLIRYLDHAFLTPDNNIAENAIRPFVVGRKNWLFANTPRGAHASATLYSLVESAKANGLDPFDYLAWLFTMLPKTPKDRLRELLPHVVDPAKVNGFVARSKLSLNGAK
jgi:transposase